jgi:hypothetical protein
MSPRSILILSIHLRLGFRSFLLAFSSISHMNSCSSHTFYIPCPSHPPWLDHSNYTWRRVQVMELLVMQFSHPPVTSSLFGPNFLLSTLFFHFDH